MKLEETKLSHKVLLYIGDASGDGHGKSDYYVFDSNYTMEQIQDAYISSCIKIGVQFNHNTYYIDIDDNRHGDNPYLICTNWCDNTISEEAKQLLLEHGIDAAEYSCEKDEILFDIDGFTNLILDFIKVSLSDLELSEASFKKSELRNIPTINSGKLNHQFGYGVTDDDY